MPKEIRVSLKEKTILLCRGGTYRVVETGTIIETRDRALLQFAQTPPDGASYVGLPLSQISSLKLSDPESAHTSPSYYFNEEYLFISEFAIPIGDISVKLKDGVDYVVLHSRVGKQNHLLLPRSTATSIPGFVRLYGEPIDQTVPIQESYFPCTRSLATRPFYVTEDFYQRVLEPRHREFVHTYGFSIPTLNVHSWYTCHYFTKKGWILTSYDELHAKGLVPLTISTGEKNGIIEVETGNPDILLVHPLVMSGPGGYLLAAAMGESSKWTIELLRAMQTPEFQKNISTYLLTQI